MVCNHRQPIRKYGFNVCHVWWLQRGTPLIQISDELFDLPDPEHHPVQADRQYFWVLDEFSCDTIVTSFFAVFDLVNDIINFPKRGSWIISVLCYTVAFVSSLVFRAYVLYAIQVLIKVLLPPFSHITSDFKTVATFRR